MNASNLMDVDRSFNAFFTQIAKSLGFSGLLTVVLVVEFFIVLMFVLKTFFSYEKRLNRSLDKLNSWLFNNKKIDTSNIRDFNNIIKKGPKRIIYYWQQYILFREDDPSAYLSMDNLIEKPLKTSSWSNNIRNLLFCSTIWALISLIFGIAFESASAVGETTFNGLAVAFSFPVFVLIIGIVAAIMLKSRKITNLDEVYHNYHIFARFITNACVDLPTFVDFDLLFSNKELEKASPQLREYYESRARKAKKEFEEAKKNDVEYVEYNFEEAGLDGSLVLERAMRETESFINKKTTALSKIAQVEAEKEALKRNYENVQKDLQRKIQTCKENITKLLEQQEATTNRMEVGFLRKQQEQEISKQESLQTEYDQEETRFTISNEELDNEIKSLRKQIEDSKEEVQKAMVAEYQTFYEKIMKQAYAQTEKRVTDEKSQITGERDQTERELAIAQTQVKRLLDENDSLRARLGETKTTDIRDGHYDDEGNYIYRDGSYHDVNGYFHDIDGRIYDKDGKIVTQFNTTQTQPEPAPQEEPVSQPEPQPEEPTLPEGAIVEPYIEEEENQPSEPVEEEIEETPVVEETTELQPTITDTDDDIGDTGDDEPPIEDFEELTPSSEEDEDFEEEEEEDEEEEEEPIVEEPEEPTPVEPKEPPKKRGRPKGSKNVAKKTASEEPAPAKKRAKRGRPRKRVLPEEPKAPRKRGRPRKNVETETPAVTTTTVKAGRGRPRKNPAPTQATINQENLKSLARINQMIGEEESKLNKMKALVNSEISKAISPTNDEAFSKEKDKIIGEIDDLKKQAFKVRQEAASEELQNINKRLEVLIKEISDLTNK